MKGIGLLLLFWGHLFTYGSIPFSIIFAFHMPLFFFIAGVLFKPTSIIQCITKCYNRYILPYIFFWLLGFVAIIIKWLLQGELEWKGYLSSTLYNLAPHQGYVGSIWFLPVLAMSLFLVNILLKRESHQSIVWKSMIILLLSGASILMENLQIHFLQITTLCTTTLFVYLGYICKDEFKRIVRMRYSNLIALFLIPIFIVLSILNKTVNIAMPLYNNYVLFMVCALSGIFITAVAADKSICRPFSFFGQRSLTIFSTHGFNIIMFTYFLGGILDQPMRRMENIPDVWCFVGGVILILSIPMCYAVNPMLNMFVKKLSIKEK